MVWKICVLLRVVAKMKRRPVQTAYTLTSIRRLQIRGIIENTKVYKLW